MTTSIAKFAAAVRTIAESAGVDVGELAAQLAGSPEVNFPGGVDAEHWLAPAEAMGLLQLPGGSDPRKSFQKIRDAMPPSAKKVIGNVQAVRFRAWRDVLRWLRRHSADSWDWSGSFPDLCVAISAGMVISVEKERNSPESVSAPISSS